MIKFLFDLMSKLYPFSDKAYILRETITALEFIYPEFTHSLLLSQDHNVDESLPIQKIEYNNSMKKISLDVFVSGNIQVEEDEQKESYLFASLEGNRGVYGVLQMRIENRIKLPELEIQFIKLFSNIIEESLENSMLYENYRQLTSDLKLINEVTHKLNSNLNLSEIISVMKKQIIKICAPTHIGFVF